MKRNPLNEEEKDIIIHKGTERPFTGEFCEHKEKGLYICRQCEEVLYKSEDKFDSACGWASFDDQIAKNVLHKLDSDGKRIEILCNSCGGHLGHVFEGEEFTAKNTRHCVNSLSLKFISKSENK